MFAAVFLIFNYKIFTRYFEHDEAVWADEVLVILFIWIIFWANALSLRDKRADQLRSGLSAAAGRRQAHGCGRACRILIGGVFLSRCRDRSATSGFCGASTRRCSNLPLDLGLFLFRHVSCVIACSSRAFAWRG